MHFFPANCRPVLLACLLTAGFVPATHARPDKNRQTPCFWQRDPEGEFENAGAGNCAPVSVADGLVYLQDARGLDGLADTTDHDGQIALITDLVDAMKTDPKKGTTSGQILLGLTRYVKQRGYSCKRLEVTTWSDLGSANKQYLVGTQPDLDQAAVDADDPDTVVLFGFGWYQQNADGTYKRTGGHWVNVVGTGQEEGTFRLHNPLVPSDKQRVNNEVTVEAVNEEFSFTDSNGKPRAITTYYPVHGPGLPAGKSIAVLDGVIVFQLERD